MDALAAEARGWKSLSLSTRILISLGLGILVGLVFEEPAAVLRETPGWRYAGNVNTVFCLNPLQCLIDRPASCVETGNFR